MFRVEGLREAQKVFERLSRGGVFEQPLKKFGYEVVASVAPYPPEPTRPGAVVHRTGALGRGWYVKAQKRLVEIGNRALYSGWVQDKGRQTWFHLDTGWSTVQTKADEHLPNLEQAGIDVVYRELSL